MPRRAAWTAQLYCVTCTYRAPVEPGATRECPACGGFLRMELKRREVPNPVPARAVAAASAPRRGARRAREERRA